MFFIFFLIEREDSEKEHPHYANDYASINANWNQWLAQIAHMFSTNVSYSIRQKSATKFLAIQKFMWSYPCLLLFSNKILIEREESEKQYFFYYTDNYAGINANWNLWLAQVATIFSTHVFYLIDQKCATRFSAIQKFIWFCPCLPLFSNKILIEREDSKK